MQVIFTQSNEMALVKMYATSTVLLRVVHHYFILNHALSTIFAYWKQSNGKAKAPNECSTAWDYFPATS